MNDALGRRTKLIDSAPSMSATNEFAFNPRSEVTNAVMGTSEYAYNYDDIGKPFPGRPYKLTTQVADVET